MSYQNKGEKKIIQLTNYSEMLNMERVQTTETVTVDV